MAEFEHITIKKGPVRKKKVVEKPSLPLSETKGKIRKRINDEVGDIYQLVANLSDSVSLLTSTISAMYNVMSDTDKANIPAAEKALIDHMVAKFQATTTSADLDIAAEGVVAVDKLIEPQGAVGTIMQEEKNVVI